MKNEKSVADLFVWGCQGMLVMECFVVVVELEFVVRLAVSAVKPD